ncbi:hypothetical protein CY34DRAFT_15957, partial [Suillus luteus UH-Slu-Lm8-n1]
TVADTNLDHSQEGSQKSALSAAPITVAKDAVDIAAVSSAEILQGPSLVLERRTGSPDPLDDDFNDDEAFKRSVAILLQKNPRMRLSIGGWPYDPGARDGDWFPGPSR